MKRVIGKTQFFKWQYWVDADFPKTGQCTPFENVGMGGGISRKGKTRNLENNVLGFAS